MNFIKITINNTLLKTAAEIAEAWTNGLTKVSVTIDFSKLAEKATDHGLILSTQSLRNMFTEKVCSIVTSTLTGSDYDCLYHQVNDGYSVTLVLRVTEDAL